VTINGDEVEVHYGDKVVSLPERLDKQDQEIRLMKRMLVGGGVLFVIHAFDLLPLHDLFPLLLRLVGL
jgi:hypothetical protein